MSSIPGSHTTASAWLAEGRRVVAATLIEAVGSSPLDPGAEMLVDDQGRIDGSVTGGCVEGALVVEAEALLAGGPPRVVSYGISDEQAVDVGLMCGGQVTLFVHELVEPTREPLAFAHAAIAEGRPVALATLLDGPAAGSKLAVTADDEAGTLASTPLLDISVRRDARGYLDQGLSVVRRYSAKGEEMGDDVRVYIQSFATPPRMIIFGAIDFSAAIAGFAGELGYRVTICDARPPFAQSRRFSAVAEVVIDWPDRFLAGQTLGPRDVVLVFTHDAKFDEPALTAALATNAGYIGALGSRRTQADREARLRDAGATDSDIARISAPCGLDIGARTPHETAVSILGEIIARAAGRDGRRLDQASGPIHPERIPVT